MSTALAYWFGGGDKEIASIIAGKAEVLLHPDKQEWVMVSEGDSFTIIRDSSYQLRRCEFVEYLCEFIPGN
ncbi:MAG: pyrimidine/purine nucleoside phosphorylase [Thermovirgaceae bacterium]|nr:pyrimidine/purine nucleoside phosphorylase [Thermovirgaceae bacterium]